MFSPLRFGTLTETLVPTHSLIYLLRVRALHVRPPACTSVKTASESVETFAVTLVSRKDYCVTSRETKDLLCYFV